MYLKHDYLVSFSFGPPYQVLFSRHVLQSPRAGEVSFPRHEPGIGPNLNLCSPSTGTGFSNQPLALPPNHWILEPNLKQPHLPTPNSRTHVAITVTYSMTRIFINGVSVASGTQYVSLASWGGLTSPYIGRSQYSSDPYLSAYLRDFKVYPSALT